MATFQTLVAGGADANKRPYVWNRVYMNDNEKLNARCRSSVVNGKSVGVEEDLKAKITDEQTQECFSKGTRTINEAIAKDMAWESQVDLLLKYIQLDEESLEAANRMIRKWLKKFSYLWQAQNEN